MAEVGWFTLLSAALGGGFTVKLLDIGYHELRRRLDTARSARHFVDQHLDPLLKSADELVGKLRSLAEEDFQSLYNIDPMPETIENNHYSSLLFLISKFWANIEIIRLESLSVSIAKDERGRRLQNFMDCIESRRVRLIDRISQRAVGELMLHRRDQTLESISFIAFVRLIESEPSAQRWIAPLARTASRLRHTTERQRLLQYGAVIHAMIDTLDPEHHATRERPSYPNKLSKKSRRDLRYRVFGQYLSFVPNTDKYIVPPPKRRP